MDLGEHVGNQRFPFPANLSLAHGVSVIVTSGPSARTGNGVLQWTKDYVWRNAGDPGQLLDTNGTVRTRTPGP